MRRAVVLAAVVLTVGTLWYLRDPAWLIDQTTGLRAPQREADGKVTRWSGGHASFFDYSGSREGLELDLGGIDLFERLYGAQLGLGGVYLLPWSPVVLGETPRWSLFTPIPRRRRALSRR